MSSVRAETQSVPEDRIETASGRTRRNATCVHDEEHGKRDKSRVKLRILPDSTKVPERAEEVGQQEFLAVPGGTQDGAYNSRKLHYSPTSPTRSSPSRDRGTSPSLNLIEDEPKSDTHEATSSIASEDFETWWQTRGVPEPDIFTALEQKAQLVHGNDAHDDVSSEEDIEVERMYWRAGHERSVSPEDVSIQLQAPTRQDY